ALGRRSARRNGMRGEQCQLFRPECRLHPFRHEIGLLERTYNPCRPASAGLLHFTGLEYLHCYSHELFSGGAVMRWFGIIVPALAMATALATPAVAANSVIIKNSGSAPVQIGFDRGATQTIVPRATAAVTLNAGQHTA